MKGVKMNNKPKLLGYYNYTVILTYIGMLSGFLGIISASEGNVKKAVICLIVSGVCDMFDGTIASTMKRTDAEKSFGIQIDSLSDLICFGVLPAVITCSLNEGSRIALCISALYALCALIRLAYFNVDEIERQKNSTGGREYYLGMPVTLSSFFVPVIYFTCQYINKEVNTVMMGALVIMAVLFLLPFSLKKPKFLAHK